MNSVFSGRLQLLISQSGKYAKDIADDLEVTQTRLSNYQLGKSDPPSDFLIGAARYFNVSTDFLLGVMDGEEANTPEDSVRLIRMKNLFLRMMALEDEGIKEEAIKMFENAAGCLESYLDFATVQGYSDEALDSAKSSMDALREIEKIAMPRIRDMIVEIIKDDSAAPDLKDRVSTRTSFRIAPAKRNRGEQEG